MSAVAEGLTAEDESPPPPVRKRRRRWTSFILPTFTGVMIFYLASPVFVMMLYGFNDLAGERQIPRFTCCTLRWWRQILEIDPLNDALVTSIEVAVVSASIATLLGTMIGLVLGRYRFSGRSVVNFVIFLAIAIPEIVLGSALLTMFVEVNVSKPLGISIALGKSSILLSHVGFSIAFVAIVVRARVQGFDRSLENAAQDLFATPLATFFKVTLPMILPGILAGFLLAFVLSLDDFVITNFVSGKTNTFPTYVYSTTRIGVPPQVNVWGSVLFLAGVTLAGSQLIGSRRKAAQT